MGDCVLSDNAMNIPKDQHLAAYDLESNEWKKIEQKDKNQYKSFSRGVDKKRRKKEKKLGLLGLENMDLRKERLRDSKDQNDEILVDNEKKIEKVENKKKRKFIELDEQKGEIDLNSIVSVDELKKIGMDKLKQELIVYGLKCGGTLEQRAERLFLLKHHKLSDLPKHCFVLKKKKKSSRKKQKIASQ